MMQFWAPPPIWDDATTKKRFDINAHGVVLTLHLKTLPIRDVIFPWIVLSFSGCWYYLPLEVQNMTLNMSKILNHGCQSNINMLENKHLSRLMSGTSGIASLHPKSLAFSNNGTHKHPAELENAKIRPSFACEIGSKKVNRPVGLHLSARLVGF